MVAIGTRVGGVNKKAWPQLISLGPDCLDTMTCGRSCTAGGMTTHRSRARQPEYEHQRACDDQ